MEYVSPVRNLKALPKGQAIEVTVKSGEMFETTRWYGDGVVDVIHSAELATPVTEAKLSELKVGWLMNVSKKKGPPIFKVITNASGIMTPKD